MTESTVALNPHWTGYRCTVCAREYPVDWPGFVCADCGIEGILDVCYDYAAIAAGLARDEPFPASETGETLWRFAALLPVRPRPSADPQGAWSLGATPTIRADRLAAHIGVASLWLKDDTCLPSASLKDRASAVAVARARQLGIDHLACASTGNAAASLAVLCARAGMRCTIFVPADAPPAKLAQLVLHGARVVRVDGTYDQAFELSLRLMARHGWYSRNCAHNPLLVEGKKTAALELAWQLRADSASSPLDAVFVPVGDGCIVSSVAKAYAELRKLGVTSRSPRIFGVQASGAAPLAQAWRRVGDAAATLGPRAILQAIEPVTPATVADSICVGVPRNRVRAWRAVAANRGAFLTVDDAAIVEAVGRLAATAGVFAEPSGAVGLAGVTAALNAGLVTPQSQVAVLVTGNGLKDPQSALTGLRLPEPVAHDRDDLDDP